ncbi:flavodoxin domain-containing protein [Corynebacterium sp.]|uniref:flavodoxin domain-containing protein n=1 Tax=Corynebacterium sp. TaxID=1720 RepID=UPI0026DD4FD1|nr:flavodoxin domain-containing protein [Corynebacterium sp.]MDO5032819.1 flavodoxin domain-containing protein [Corynebacterium sp.]
MTTVIYSSFYGSTHDYAAELAQRLDAELLELSAAEEPAALERLAQESAPLVVLTPVHGPSVPGAAFVSKHDFSARPVAIAAVGMTLLDVARDKDQLAGPLSDKPEVARFYLPGRMNYSELSSAHSAAMKAVVTALKLKPKKSANERSMIELYGKDVDRVDFAELEPIVEWVDAAKQR